MKKSINKKILTLLVCAMITSTLIVGGISIINVHNFSSESGEREVSLICEKNTIEINMMADRIVRTVSLLGYDALDQFDSLSILSDDSQREAYTEKMREMIRSAAQNTEGCVSAYIRYNPNYAPPTSGVFMRRETPSGKMIDLTPTDLSMYGNDDVEHVGWYYIPVNSGEAIWMDPYYNQNLGITMISYVEPLYYHKKVIGVIGMDIELDYIIKFVQGTKAYDSGIAFLLSEDKIAWHPYLKTGADYEYDPKMVYSEGTLSNGMKLVLEVPKNEIFRGRNRLTLQILAFSSTILLISVFILIKICGSITKPLRELTEKARKLSAGNMDIDFSVDSDDEVGVLAETMQETVKSLKNYVDFTKGLAYIDSLTGIKNKTAYDNFAEKMDEEIKNGEAEPFAIAMCDVNSLKFVNDTFGHEFGNLLLINSCQFICKTFKRSPVFRIGGDEFVVILKNEDYEKRFQRVSEMQERMNKSNTNPIPYERVSIAVGFSEYEPGKDLNMEQIFKRADEKMYKEKRLTKEEQNKYSLESNETDEDGNYQ